MKINKLLLTSLSIFICHSVLASSILQILQITPKAESVDYINNKKQFQLHSLVTEQRHPRTLQLSDDISNNTVVGLKSLFSVDQDISNKFKKIAQNRDQLKTLDNASKSIQKAILNGHKIYFYGTGSTGRLSEVIESSVWRPFWKKVTEKSYFPRIKNQLPNIENRLKGEITGGDRALISSLAGFEDLQLIGKLQLQDNKIEKEDVVFAVTEGGETSAVIGTILAAKDLYAGSATNNLYFIYNNPDSVLKPFNRSRSVIENLQIQKINLTTGPQAITGSTRLQATTTSLYISGIILENAIYHILKKLGLSHAELKELGFPEDVSIKNKLLDFQAIQHIMYQSAEKITPWTNLEANTYATHHKTTYFAKNALPTVFVDVTERAPTFRLNPLDTINTNQSWIKVWSPTISKQEAWRLLLQRPFHGLNPKIYQKPFENEIKDPHLKQVALTSLMQAGYEQEELYDLSFSTYNITEHGPDHHDLGVLFLLSNEPFDPIFEKWLQLFSDKKANVVMISVSLKPLLSNQIQSFKKLKTKAELIEIIIPKQDPFGLNQMIALKMLLNAHSTGVMAKLGRVSGNTMIDVHPSNLKLIGRATYLIQLKVNETISTPSWQKLYGKTPKISYAEANAILFDAITYVQKSGKATDTPEVALAITRILESLKSHKNISWQQAENILATHSPP